MGFASGQYLTHNKDNLERDMFRRHCGSIFSAIRSDIIFSWLPFIYWMKLEWGEGQQESEK